MTTYRVAARVKTKNGKKAWIKENGITLDRVQELVAQSFNAPEFCWVFVERMGEPTFPGQAA